ncbi:MAG TPA: hypothetical protein VHH88_12045 [Verrucomicrobiae bacterium]|nr:hypothetical protein [Verrucomicrobiae bacterium]
MKTCLLVCAALAAYSVQSAPKESRHSAAALPRGISVDYSKTPWVQPPAERPPLQTIVAAVNDDLNETLSEVAALNENFTNVIESAVPKEREYGIKSVSRKDYSGLPAGDLSTLLSRDFSTVDGRNLSTSLATPTSLPFCPWGNRPGTASVETPEGELLLPAYPPRTAWGNGPGVIATTPGGAVFSMVPAANAGSEKILAVADQLANLNHQLLALQDDVGRIQEGLERLNVTTNAPVTPMPPPTYQPYLPPTGR